MDKKLREIKDSVVLGYQKLDMYHFYFRVETTYNWLKLRYKDLNTAPRLTGKNILI